VKRDEVARFRRDGFVAVERPAVPPSALTTARELLDSLFDRADELPHPWVHDLAPNPDGGSVPEIVNAAHVEPRLLQTRAYRLALRAARRLLGGPAQLAFDHAIFKPAGSNGVTALHQDLAFDPSWDVPTATIWLALVDATDSNGCMRFWPQTPDGLMDHEPVGRDGLGVVGLDVAEAPAYPVPAGGFTAHSQRAVHGTGPNRTLEIRAAWILKFARDDRSRRRRAWERSLELQGVVVPRRFAELCAAVAKSDQPEQHPEWVGTFTGATQ
jgi:hypothetical protein